MRKYKLCVINKEMRVYRCYEEIISFIKNGVDTFLRASKGRYANDSIELSKIRSEVLEKESNRSDDKINLLSDRKNINCDIKKAFYKRKSLYIKYNERE